MRILSLILLFVLFLFSQFSQTRWQRYVKDPLLMNVNYMIYNGLRTVFRSSQMTLAVDLGRLSEEFKQAISKIQSVLGVSMELWIRSIESKIESFTNAVLVPVLMTGTTESH